MPCRRPVGWFGFSNILITKPIGLPAPSGSLGGDGLFRVGQFLIDLAGQDAPTEALAAIQRLGARLNPQGLTRVEVADDGADPVAWTGHYAFGPSCLAAAWLAESAKLDAQLGYTGPISLHLRYADEAPV